MKVPLLVLLAIVFFAWPLACYMTHFAMLQGDRKGEKAKRKIKSFKDLFKKPEYDTREPLKFISFSKLLKIFKKYKPDLSSDSHYPGYIEWFPHGENLRSVYLIGMEITPIEHWDRMYMELRDSRYKFYWHASILRVDGELRWLSPIGFFLFFLYSRFIAKKLHEDDFDENWKEWEAATKLFEAKHQDLVRAFNEKYTKKEE